MSNQADITKPKLPKQQLAILAIARFAEPLALTSVFPYLPEMIKGFGVPEKEVARWAGITGAAFSISQSMTAVLWGRASDTFGRKPAILLGLLSTMTCFIFWGVATSLTMAITVRAIMGAGSGNVGIIRTMVAELVPEKELQPVAFSIMPLVWSIGSVFGPAFGGFLARPAERFPDVFGRSELLKTYPFLLSNLIAFCVFFVSVITGFLFLRETLESRKSRRDWGLVLGEKLSRRFQPSRTSRLRHRRSYVDDEATAAPLLTPADPSRSVNTDNDSPSMAQIFTRETVINLVAYTFVAFHSVAADQILPVFLNYPRYVPDGTARLPFKFVGGFGINSDRIGTIFTVYGVACGIIQFLWFPPLCRRFGVLRCYRTAALVFPVVYLLIPFTALISDERARFAALLVLLVIKGGAVVISFPCITILYTNSAASLRILGTLNGFATTFSGIGRACGPALVGTVFTLGVKHSYILAPWVLLAGIALAAAIPAYFIVEGKGPRGSSAASTVVDTAADEVASEESPLLRPRK